MTPKRQMGRLTNLADAALFVALAGLAAAVYLRVFAPSPLPPQTPAFEGYDPAGMAEAMTPERVRAKLDAIRSLGSRFVGQDGFRKTESLIREAYTSAGLKVIELPCRVAAPVTRTREILDADGRPLPGVQVYPFFPNHAQPMVTPEPGLTGELLRVTPDVLRQRASFRGCIAVVDLADPPPGFGWDWIRYAERGFSALILTHRDGLARMPWATIRPNASTPVNFVRLAATEKILDHCGSRVTLRVRADWQDVDATTFVGILAGGAPEGEAVVSTACYDACSLLPDLAPGTLGALGLAAQLSLLDGIRDYRAAGLRRGVVFVATPSQMMAQMAADRLTAYLGPATDREAAAHLWREEQRANDAQLRQVRACAQIAGATGFMESAEATLRGLRALDAESTDAFRREFRFTLNALLMELSEAQLQARLAFLRTGGTATTSLEYATYLTAKRRYDEAMALAGQPVDQLAALDPATGMSAAMRWRLRDRVLARWETLLRFHEARACELNQALAIRSALKPYSRLVAVGSWLAPRPPGNGAGEAFTFFMGMGADDTSPRGTPAISDAILSAVQGARLEPATRFDSLRSRRHNDWAIALVRGLPVDSEMWNAKGYPAFTLVNSDRPEAYDFVGCPVELPFMLDLNTTKDSLHVLGRTVLSLAFGNGSFEAPKKVFLNRYSGRVVAAGVGRSVIPNHPLPGALLLHKGGTWAYQQNGYERYGFIFTDAYGRYDLPYCATRLVPWWQGMSGYCPEAVAFGADGRIAWVKDEGVQGQAVYKSMRIGWGAARENVNIVVFRAEPMTVFDLINPQSLKAFNGIEIVNRDGLTPVIKHNVFDTADGILTAFVEPDRPVYVTFKAGSPQNEWVQTTRAFALNTDEDAEQLGRGVASRRPSAQEVTAEGRVGRPADLEQPPAIQPHGRRPATPLQDSAGSGASAREIDGPGYLPADTPFLLDPPRAIARSMAEVNGQRLALQERHAMADEPTRTFQARSRELLDRGREPSLTDRDRLLLDREAATYTILNHPVLRESVFEAVTGILWYLALLVPFVFFFEKLVFAFADIRRQLAAQAAIFLVVFALLRVLHPAFEMIQSSLMILLGFVIMMISGGVTLLFSGKFRENFEELKKQRGQVAAAEVNTLGVMATAFSLGLNNMHRRKVRTGLTCATLVLLTFAMICFTSIRNDVVSTFIAIGKAHYPGIMVKREKMAPISEGELYALQTRYGSRFIVAPRAMLTGVQTFDRLNLNPEIEAVYEPAGGEPRKTPVASILTLASDEPLQGKIELLTRNGWFYASERPEPDELPPVLIPDTLAAELSIRPDAVEAGGVKLKLNGKPVRVHGIFRAASLAALRDLDDRDLLPFDVAAMATVQTSGEDVLAEDDDARLPADRIILGLHGMLKDWPVSQGRARLASVAVVMPGLPYREARDEMDRYLEQSGQITYLGLDDRACRAQRARVKSVAGLLELVIPLLIATMTVLNTMKGSVYERREEIYVYNALGIAPRYIFGMFLGEAFVYSVVGCVLGYLLSQGVGRVLTVLGWTGGLNMTFTSIATVYASLAMIVAVFLSTVFPARTAMRLAAPAEDAGWTLPEPDGDQMRFALPFTFDARSRVAVLAFFRRHFVDHGEGSSGAFFAGEPVLGVTEGAGEPSASPYVPHVTTTIWLKPFDLGVSQELTISLPTDPATHEYIATVTLTRLSGTRESWIRLNRPFVQGLRQHFLYWRAVSPEEREELFGEARERLAPLS